ncbi:MAG: tetratricopeptide repeat protein [Zoogloeaceae bacterium]|nr:tetratricopeptide repeat protein [Zoogloeaceae bacterium]
MKNKASVLFRIAALAAAFLCAGAHAQTEEPTFIERDMVSGMQNQAALRAYQEGTRFMHANLLAEAEERLLAAIELEPDFVDALDHLGIVYRKQQEYAKAEKVYLRSIEIDPENTVPYANLALIYRLQERLDQAIQVYETLMQRFPDDPESYYGLGQIHSQRGDYKKSIGYLDQAIEKYRAIDSPYIYHAYAIQAENHYALKENGEALMYYMLISLAYPEDPHCKGRIEELENSKGDKK